MQIRRVSKLTQAELEQTAKLHYEILKDSFLNNFGYFFLFKIYYHLVQDKNNIVLVISDKKRIIGFLVATTNGKILGSIPINSDIIKELFRGILRKPNLLLPLFQGILNSASSKSGPELQFIAISEDYQGKGLGGKMLTQLDSCFANNQIKEYIVGTRADNPLANNFYKKNGFKYLYKKKYFGNLFNYYYRNIVKGKTG